MISKQSFIPWTLVTSSGGWFRSQETLTVAAAQSPLDCRATNGRLEEHKAALRFTLQRVTMLVTFPCFFYSQVHQQRHSCTFLASFYWSAGQQANILEKSSAGWPVGLPPYKIPFQPHREEPSTAVINKHYDWYIQKFLALKKLLVHCALKVTQSKDVIYY